ncbi:MAG: hypothetical protein R2852_02195 [Bacteroidia bacterium]
MKSFFKHGLLGLLFLLNSLAHSQFHAHGVHANTAGNNSLLINNAFSALNNPAYASVSKQTCFALSGSNFYALRALNQQSICFNYPIKQSSFMATFSQFGNKSYVLNQTGLGISHQFNPKLSAGLKTNLNTFKVKTYGETHYFSLELSLFSQLNSKLSMAFKIDEILSSNRSEGLAKSSIQTSKWALGYQIDKKVKVLLELNKSVEKRPSLNFGVLYGYDTSFQISSGYSNDFNEIGLGLSWKKNKVKLGCGAILNVLLGITSTIEISYEFKD